MPFQFGTNWSRFSAAAEVISPLLAYERLTAFFLETAFPGLPGALLAGRELVAPAPTSFGVDGRPRDGAASGSSQALPLMGTLLPCPVCVRGRRWAFHGKVRGRIGYHWLSLQLSEIVRLVEFGSGEAPAPFTDAGAARGLHCLRNDLDDPARRRIDQHRRIVDDRVLVARHTVFRRNRMKYHAFVRQNVANDDARVLRPSVRRDVLLDDIVVEPRSLRAGQPADDASRSLAWRPDDGADGAAPLIGVGRRRQPREKKCEYQGFRHHSLLK